MEANFSGMIQTPRGKDKAHSLSFSLYNGNVQLAVFDRNSEERRPPISLNLSREFIDRFISLSKPMVESREPGLRESIYFNEWDRDEKKMKKVVNFIFGISDKGQFYFEFKKRGSETPYKFVFWPDGRLTIPSLGDKTDYVAPYRAFMEELQNLYNNRGISRLDYHKKKYNNNRGGSGASSFDSSKDSEDEVF